MIAQFNRFEIKMTLEQARGASHQGRCDEDVEALLKLRHIQKQLQRISPTAIREELKEYGAWDEEELADHEANMQRIVWIAAGNIVDENPKRR
jgi:hypothetical protein